MIESTPQLFGNAWRVSSACAPSLIVPQLDPCDTHQQAGWFVSSLPLYFSLALILVKTDIALLFPPLSGLRLTDVRDTEPGSVLRLP